MSRAISDTLKVVHFPNQMTDEHRDKFMKLYGAIRTQTVRSTKYHALTYAQFSSSDIALEVMLRLHQLKLKNCCLTVEFTSNSVFTDSSKNDFTVEINTEDEVKKETTNNVHFQAFLERLNGWTMNPAFTEPPPPNIQYKYPLPTKNILLRICLQLLTKPTFYNQVLHLMNKMNLPPPFEELDIEFPLLKKLYDLSKLEEIFGKKVICKENNSKVNGSDDDESEMESDEDTIPVPIIPSKRKNLQSTKRMKIPKFVNPAKQNFVISNTQKIVKPEEMFESVKCNNDTKMMKIELKSISKLLNTDCTEVESNINSSGESGFGILESIKNVDKMQTEKECENKNDKKYITAEELAENRIPAAGQKNLPVFKNYHPGVPTNRLYVKNLAKQVEIEDLHYIFRRYISQEISNFKESYEVRLMQEGRMKGQAFITLQNLEQAQLALYETNGYILKDKPMVVQFARATKS